MPLISWQRSLLGCLLVLLAAPVYGANGRGVEFWAAWPRTHASLETSAQLVILADQPTNVAIDGAFVASGVADSTAPWIVSIPDTLRTAVERIPVDVGFRIYSTDGVSEISVLLRVPEQAEASDDIARLLPVSELGTRYVVLGYSAAIPVAPSYYAVVATQDATVLNTTTTCGGDTGPVALDAGQVYQVFCDTTDTPPDVTGSILDADKPVVVFGGSSNAWVPTDLLSGDFLIESLVPIADWDLEFLTAPLPKGPNPSMTEDVIRIAASAPANVTVDDGASQQVIPLAREGDWTEIRTDRSLHITSDAPIDVHQYATGFEAADLGDPFQVTVPSPAASYGPYLRVYIPPDYSEGSYVTLFAPTADTALVRLAGQPVATWNPTPSPQWSWAEVSLGQFTGIVLITSPSVVGAFAHGYNAEYIPDPDLGRVPGSYGYPATEALPACRVTAVGAGPAEACPDSLIQLGDGGTVVEGCQNVEYRWLIGGTPVVGCGFSSSPDCETLYTQPTEYVLEVRCTDDPTNCAPGTVFVPVLDSTPELLSLLPDPAEVCEGQTIFLEAPSGYTSYDWSSVPDDPGVTPQTTFGPQLPATPDMDTTYSVTARGGSECVGQGDLPVTVLPDPIPPALGNILQVRRSGGAQLELRWTDPPGISVSGFGAVSLGCGDRSACSPDPDPLTLEGLAAGPMAPPATGSLVVTPPSGELVFLKLRGLSPCSGSAGSACDGFVAQVPCP